jgi:hypothetical protein
MALLLCYGTPRPRNVVERALRPIAMTESFCSSFVSVCKQRELVFWSCPTRATFSPGGCGDRLGL